MVSSCFIKSERELQSRTNRRKSCQWLINDIHTDSKHQQVMWAEQLWVAVTFLRWPMPLLLFQSVFQLQHRGLGAWIWLDKIRQGTSYVNASFKEAILFAILRKILPKIILVYFSVDRRNLTSLLSDAHLNVINHIILLVTIHFLWDMIEHFARSLMNFRWQWTQSDQSKEWKLNNIYFMQMRAKFTWKLLFRFLKKLKSSVGAVSLKFTCSGFIHRLRRTF